MKRTDTPDGTAWIREATDPPDAPVVIVDERLRIIAAVEIVEVGQAQKTADGEIQYQGDRLDGAVKGGRKVDMPRAALLAQGRQIGVTTTTRRLTLAIAILGTLAT